MKSVIMHTGAGGIIGFSKRNYWHVNLTSATSASTKPLRQGSCWFERESVGFWCTEMWIIRDEYLRWSLVLVFLGWFFLFFFLCAKRVFLSCFLNCANHKQVYDFMNLKPFIYVYSFRSVAVFQQSILEIQIEGETSLWPSSFALRSNKNRNAIADEQ